MTNTITLAEALHDLPQIQTPRLLLRRLRLDDAEDMFVYASDPAVTATVTFETHLSIDDSLEFISQTLDGYERGERATWGIEHRQDQHLVGTVGYPTIRAGGYIGEAGYVLSRPYWRQGLMTEALGAVLDFGFRHMALRRIEATCRIDNIGSYRVMEKCGMQLDGILRDADYVKGRLISVRLYSILRRDYERAHRPQHLRRLQPPS